MQILTNIQRTMIGEIILAALSIVFSATLASAGNMNQVKLKTTLGDVIGERKPVGSGLPMVEVFYGIPYARPPVGARRFRAPLPSDPWCGSPLDGTVRPAACWQLIDTSFDQFAGVNMWNPTTNRSEDCLYLNIWRPDSRTGSGRGKSSNPKHSHRAIMVWIHGGAFLTGSATLEQYEPSQLVIRENVVVVTIGYRLGPLGFLYLGTSAVPGNAGLLDQNMALRWVKDNAVNLGGSPDDITIFGQSAGAISVGLHMFSPLSRNLFKNAIMQSASPLAPFTPMDLTKAKARSLNLATIVSCLNQTQSENVDYDAVLICLQSVDALTLTTVQFFVDSLNWFDLTFAPIVDGTFLTAHPTQLLQDGDVKNTSLIAGVVKDEGIFFGVLSFRELQNFSRQGQLNSSEFNKIMLEIAGKNDCFKTQLIDQYSKSENNSYSDSIDAAIGDSLLKCPIVDFAREYVKLGGKVYMYSFEENFSSNPWPDYMGVPHFYDIEGFFGIPLKCGTNNSNAEKKLAAHMLNWWANFAKTGYPTDDRRSWPAYTTKRQEYVIIDSGGLHCERRLRRDQCQWWATRDPRDQFKKPVPRTNLQIPGLPDDYDGSLPFAVVGPTVRQIQRVVGDNESEPTVEDIQSFLAAIGLVPNIGENERVATNAPSTNQYSGPEPIVGEAQRSQGDIGGTQTTQSLLEDSGTKPTVADAQSTRESIGVEQSLRDAQSTQGEMGVEQSLQDAQSTQGEMGVVESAEDIQDTQRGRGVQQRLQDTQTTQGGVGAQQSLQDGQGNEGDMRVAQNVQDFQDTEEGWRAQQSLEDAQGTQEENRGEPTVHSMQGNNGVNQVLVIEFNPQVNGKSGDGDLDPGELP